MTQRDRDRLVVLKKAQKKLIGQGQAAREPGITARQVRRLLVRLRKEGRPSHHSQTARATIEPSSGM